MRKLLAIGVILISSSLLAGPTLSGSGDGWAEVVINTQSQQPVLLRSHSSVNFRELFPDAVFTESNGLLYPSYRAVIGVPPEGEVKVDIKIGTQQSYSGIQLETTGIPGIEEYSIPEQQPDKSQFVKITPSARYEITRWRDYRVVIVEYTPVGYDPASGELTVSNQVKIKVSFDKPRVLFSKTGNFVSNNNLNHIYASDILNYQQCRNWAIPAVSKIPANPFASSSNWVKISMAEDGIYKISYHDLQKAGVSSSSIDPTTLRVMYPKNRKPGEAFPDDLSELPIYVHGQSDGRFDRDDYLVFFGKGAKTWNFTERDLQTSPYVEENVYWLTWGAAKGKRMQTRPVPPQGGDFDSTADVVLHFEEDHECPARAGILWLWSKIQKTTQDSSETFKLDLAGLSSVDTFSAKIEAPNSAVGFRVLVAQDTLIYRSRKSANPIYSTVKPNVPVSNIWDLTVEVSGSGQLIVYPDWFRIVGKKRLRFDDKGFWVYMKGAKDYFVENLNSTPFILDVNDPFNPVILTDWKIENGGMRLRTRIRNTIPIWFAQYSKLSSPKLELLSPGSLWNENWSVDFLILTTALNMQAAEDYAEYRLKTLHINGVATPKIKVVGIDEIVRDFGYGVKEPQAVKHFLSYAYQKGGGKLLYVLIIGDGTYDYRNKLNYSNTKGFFLVNSYGSSLNPNVTDNSALTSEVWFGDFDTSTLYAPEVVVSRITAREPRDVYTYLDKLKSYQQASGAWRTKLILLADDFYKGSPNPAEWDAIGNHVSACEQISTLLSPEFDPVKVYLSDFSYKLGGKPDAKFALLDALSQGGRFFFFFGHGKGDQLTHEKVLMLNDIPMIHNGSKLPFAMFCSCGVGRFDDTRSESLAEEIVRAKQGAIASLAATKGTSGGSNETLAKSLVHDFRNMKNANIGDLFFSLTSKHAFGAWIYVLFGDPGIPFDYPTQLNVSNSVDSFITTDTAAISFKISQVASDAHWSSSAYGGWVFKRDTAYSYDYGRNLRIHTYPYYKKGELLYRATGKLDAKGENLKFIVPRGIKDTKTAYWYILCEDSDSTYVFRKDSIVVSQGSVAITDKTGPQVRFLANGTPLTDGDTISGAFDLTVEFEDPSGINLTGLSGLGIGGEDSLSLIINKDKSIDLAKYFEYQETASGMATKGKATVPIVLGFEKNELVVNAVDNMRNLSTHKLTLYASFVSKFNISDVLVYPNPVSSNAEFTFDLNAAADVSIQIFSQSGRPLRRLPAAYYPSGYGSYLWDGLDSDAQPLPNGVYIFRLSGKTRKDDIRVPNSADVVMGKFIVVR